MESTRCTSCDLTDVSALGSVRTLILRFTRVTDVSALGGVHTLDLSNNDRLPYWLPRWLPFGS